MFQDDARKRQIEGLKKKMRRERSKEGEIPDSIIEPEGLGGVLWLLYGKPPIKNYEYKKRKYDFISVTNKSGNENAKLVYWMKRFVDGNLLKEIEGLLAGLYLPEPSEEFIIRSSHRHASKDIEDVIKSKFGKGCLLSSFEERHYVKDLDFYKLIKTLDKDIESYILKWDHESDMLFAKPYSVEDDPQQTRIGNFITLGQQKLCLPS